MTARTRFICFLFCSFLFAHGVAAQESNGAYIAYAYAFNPSADSYDLVDQSFNPLGGITVSRSELGSYTVRFGNLGTVMSRGGTQIGPSPEVGAGGTIQVVTHNPIKMTGYCKVANWYNTNSFASAGDLFVNVLCFDSNGKPADTRFSVLFLEPAIDSGPLGFAYVENPQHDAVLANPYAFNGAGGDVSSRALETGRYAITFDNMARFADPDVPGGGALVHVTAQGTDASQCQLTGWGENQRGGFEANVVCYAPTGKTFDAPFTVLVLWPGSALGSHAYALADDAINPEPYEPLVAFNPEGIVEVDRQTLGQYLVRFEDFGADPAFTHVQVTPNWGSSAACNVSAWDLLDKDLFAAVDCVDDSGRYTDTGFSISVHAGTAPVPGLTATTINFNNYEPGTVLTRQAYEEYGLHFPKGVRVVGCNVDNTDCPRARSARGAIQGLASEFSRDAIQIRFATGQSEVAASLNGAFLQDGTPREVTMTAYSRSFIELEQVTATVTSDPRWSTRLVVRPTSLYPIRYVEIEARELDEGVSDNQIVLDDLYFDNPSTISDFSDPEVSFPNLTEGQVFDGERFETRVRAYDFTLETVTMRIINRTDDSIVPGSDRVLCGAEITICPTTLITDVGATLPVQGEYALEVTATDAFDKTTSLSRTFFYLPPAPAFVHKVSFNQSVTNRLYDRNIFPPEDVFIVPGKELLLRYFLHSEGRARTTFTAALSVTIEYGDGSSLRRTISPNANASSVNLLPLPDDTGTQRRDTLVTMRADLDRTLNYVIPGEWFEDAVFTEFVLWDGVAELSRAQIRDTRDNKATLGLQVVYVNDQQYLNLGRDNFDDNVRPYLEQAMPFGDVTVLSERGFNFNGVTLFDFSPCKQLIFAVSLYGDDFGPSGLPSDTRLWWSKGIFATGDDLFGSRCFGIGNRPGRNFMARFSGGSTSHEIGHNIGQRHASNAHGESGGGDFEPWPYYHGALGQVDGTFGTMMTERGPVGTTDAGSWDLFLVDPCPTDDLAQRFGPSGCALMDDTTHVDVPHELMSYGTGNGLNAAPIPNTRGRWPSFDTYSDMFNGGEIRPPFAPNPALLLASTTTQPSAFLRDNQTSAYVFIVSALLEEDGETLLLPMAAREASVTELARQVQGNYLVELLNANGAPLASTSVLGSEWADADGRPTFIQALLPQVEGLAAIRISDENQVLIEQAASPASPEVKVLAPNGGEHITEATMEVHWEASDQDEDPLSYMIEYSPDNGETWTTLQVVLPGQPTHVTVPTQGLTESTRARLRITASDGINITSDLSDGYFAIGPNPPATSQDLYTFDRDTREVRRLTFLDDTDEYNPDWSPDGQMIVHDVVLLEQDGTFIRQDLYVTDLSTRTSTLLPGGEGGNDAAWQPGGSEILFDRCGNLEAEECDPSLYRVAATGGTPSLVRADAIQGDWDPTGTQVVFHQPSDGSLRILDLSSSQERVLPTRGTHPTWSADGEWMAFVRDGDIFVIRLAGSDRPNEVTQRVTVDAAADGQPAWHPLHSSLAFHSDREGSFDIFRVNIGKTPRIAVGVSPTGDYDPSWSPDGTAVVFSGDTGAWAMQQPETASPAAHPPAQRPHHAPSIDVQAYPNPFNPSTTIRFTLADRAAVDLAVFDVLGRRVAHLIDATLGSGTHQRAFDASGLPTGTYFYRLQIGDQSLTKPIILLR